MTKMFSVAMFHRIEETTATGKTVKERLFHNTVYAANKAEALGLCLMESELLHAGYPLVYHSSFEVELPKPEPKPKGRK